MRRSAYPNLRVPEGTCPGTCMEPAPSCACSTRLCPSRMPGPASPPLWSAELSNRLGAHHYPRGASLGKQRGWCPLLLTALRRGSIPVLWLGQWPGCSQVAPDSCPGDILGQTLLSAAVSAWGWGGGCRSYSPFGPKTEGMRQCRWPPCCQGSHREVAAGFGKSWRGVGRVCLWGWAHLVQLTRGSLMEDRLHCTPSLQCRGFPCLSLLQCMKTQMRA